MATAKAATARKPVEAYFHWEGRDRTGKTLRGEMKAGGQNVVMTTLRRQGITVNKVKKQRKARG